MAELPYWWEVGLFDLQGNQIADMSKQAFDDSFTRVLNGVDQYDFSLYLDEPLAAIVQPLATVVKLWRHTMTAVRPRFVPNFCGVVASRTRNASARTATYSAFSPFWRLKHRYHIDPHDWTMETGRGMVGVADDPPTTYNRGSDPSEIMMQHIEWTNLLVGYSTGDKTAIVPWGVRADYTSADPSVLLNERYDRGQNTWDLITSIVELPGMPDLDPTYIHVDGSIDMMIFNTTITKGYDRGFTLGYRTEPFNLDDLTETTTAETDEYANYVVVQGQGDTDAEQEIQIADGTTRFIDGHVEWFSNPSPAGGAWVLTGGVPWTPPNLIDEHGLYMSFDKLDNASTYVSRRARAQYQLKRRMFPPVTYEPSLSPAATWSWMGNVALDENYFDVGDIVQISCDRDTMSLSGVRRRLQQYRVSRGADNVESISMSLIEHYKEFEP